MSAKEYSKLDHFLIKAKDIGLLSLLGFVFYLGGAWSGMPKKVEASEEKIVVIQKWQAEADVRFAKWETKLDYLIKGMDEIKGKV